MRDERRTADRRAVAPAGPWPPGGLSELAELLAGESDRSRRFLAGLVLGGLVGAALAGGSLLRRRDVRPRR